MQYLNTKSIPLLKHFKNNFSFLTAGLDDVINETDFRKASHVLDILKIFFKKHLVCFLLSY